MSSIAADMRGGFDSFIAKQKELQGECKVTLTQFDDKYEVVYKGKDLDEVPPLVLEPRGWTALLDAVGRTINETGARLRKLAESKRPERVLFVIITDGMENKSVEFTREKVFEMITHQREKYSWEFIFLGANQDAIATARDLGISLQGAATYQASAVGTQAAWNSVSTNALYYRSAKGLQNMQNLYDVNVANIGTAGEKKP